MVSVRQRFASAVNGKWFFVSSSLLSSRLVSVTTMAPVKYGHGASIEGNAGVKSEREQSADTDMDGRSSTSPNEESQHYQSAASPTSDGNGAARKRRKSRKGLDKRFECTAEGCGKSYSRAEHL